MKTHTGFTLIEVLIAMLVLAIGLLGMAALQTYTLRSNQAAYTHGQATQLLSDMADRMRASSRVLNNSTSTPTVAPNTLLNTYIIGDSSKDNRTAGKTVSSSDPCRTVGNTTCDSAALIVYDLIEWNDAITKTLPNGRACIASTDNVVFYLYITWDENRSGGVSTDVGIPTGCANTFSTYVAPSSNTTHDPIFSVSLQL